MAVLAALGTALGGSAGTLATSLAAGSTLLGGLSSMQQSSYQAAVANQNAKIANENARRAIERAQIEQEDQDASSLAAVGQLEALQGASGLSLTGRSAMLARKSLAKLGRRDALNVRQAGELEAYNYKLEAANYKAAAQSAKSQGIGALLGSVASAAGTVLGGPGFNNTNTSMLGAAGSVNAGSAYLQSLLNPRRRAY